MSPLKTDAAKINVGEAVKIKWSDNIRDDSCISIIELEKHLADLDLSLGFLERKFLFLFYCYLFFGYVGGKRVFLLSIFFHYAAKNRKTPALIAKFSAIFHLIIGS